MTNAQVSKYGKVLYYPYIEIQDTNWLKLSLLCWDGIRRIVPTPVLPKDDVDVLQVIDAGLLQNTAPDEYRDNASEKFLALLKPLVEEGGWGKMLHGDNHEWLGRNFLESPDLAPAIWEADILKKFVPVFRLHPARGSKPMGCIPVMQ